MSPLREIAPPTPEAFFEEVVPAGQPILMRGLVADWPWVGLDADALLDAVERASLGKDVMTFRGNAEMGGRYDYSGDLSGFNFARAQEPLSALIADLRAGEAGHAYAGGVNIDQHLPSFRDTHAAPLLPEQTERLSSLWIGGPGRVPAHYDLPDNIACCVHGTRTFTLFPPDQIGNLYIGPIDRTLAGQPSALVDVEAPDLERFPRFAKAQARALTATLEPGDAVYVPSQWYHAVRSDGPLGVLVNFWWREAPAHAFTPQFTLMHALLSLRGMPRRERLRWRELFDHYVFEADENTLDHIPEEARGVLSELTPETAEQLRQYLGRHLLRR